MIGRLKKTVGASSSPLHLLNCQISLALGLLFSLTLDCAKQYKITFAMNMFRMKLLRGKMNLTNSLTQIAVNRPPTSMTNLLRLGWVCYAEKTHFKVPSGDDADCDNSSSFLLKHLSRVRSPQQILAGLLKRPKDSRQKELFTVFVMPCYDKKLEASRSEFTIQQGSESEEEKEADLVLGTNEFLTVLEALVKKSSDSQKTLETAIPRPHTRYTKCGSMPTAFDSAIDFLIIYE